MESINRGSFSLACNINSGTSPRVIFCSGFNSSRFGNKAIALETWCQSQGFAYTRFDYSGHGESGGEFADGSISTWLDDTLSVIDHAKEKSVVLIGSSMGGWLALLAALARPDKVCGLVLIACAADMTRTYPAKIAGLELQQDAKSRAYFEVDNQYDDGEAYRIYQSLIEDGEQYYLLDKPIELNLPVRLIHGINDDVVEWQRSLEIQQKLRSQDVVVTLLKNGDHRLSEPHELQSLFDELGSLLKQISDSQ